MTGTQKSLLRRLLWALIFVIGTAAAAVRFVPEPGLPQRPVQASQAGWALPATANYDLNMAYKDLVRLKPWGGTDQGTQGGSRSGEWRLRGVVRKAENRFALIETDRKVRRYVPGDTLPGGETLQAVHDDYIEVKDLEGVRIIRMYR